MSENNTKLFREKSIEAIESPEAIGDHLRVISPKAWLLPAGIALIMIGVIVWSVLGHIDTNADVTVQSSPDGIVCYIPETALQAVLDGENVTVNGETLTLQPEAIETRSVTEDTNVLVRMNCGLNYGDTVYTIPASGTLDPGIYSGTIRTESLKPVTLLFS